MRDRDASPARPGVKRAIMNRAAAVSAVALGAVLLACTGSEAAAPEAVTVEMAAHASTTPAPTSASEARAGFYYSGELTQGGFIRGKAPANAVSAMIGDQAVALAADGTFFAAFDRDAPTNLPLVATLANGQQVNETLAVSPRQWNIERVNIARSPGGMTDAFWKIREPELNAINAARAKDNGATGWSQDFIWPVKGRISGRFGRQRIYRGEPGSYHSGLDIAPGAGVPYVAPADGVVVLARTGFSLEGGLIIIDHGHGLNSAFLHSSRIVVSEGQHVRQGEHIGNVGSTGRATGPHLHWSLKWNDARLDPLLFVGPQN